MATSKNWKVGNTAAIMFGVGGRHGFGFSIQSAHGAPLLSIGYETEDEAREAEALVRKAIEAAIDVAKP